MNTFQISCFLAVAEHLNFARAAEQLHVTQPAVTQQIHSLEKELGVSLFPGGAALPPGRPAAVPPGQPGQSAVSERLYRGDPRPGGGV